MATQRVHDIAMSALEDTLAFQMRAAMVPLPMREWSFHQARRWRFDFAWPAEMLAVECEGGIWSNGDHNRPKRFISDCDKYNEAALLGWTVLRFTERHIHSGEALQTIERALLERMKAEAA